MCVCVCVCVLQPVHRDADSYVLPCTVIMPINTKNIHIYFAHTIALVEGLRWYSVSTEGKSCPILRILHHFIAKIFPERL